MEEVRKAGYEEAVLEKAFALLQQVMQKSWQEGENDRGDAILNLFHQIRSGQSSFAPAIKAIVAKVQDKGIHRAYLPRLLAQCLAAPHDERLSYRLILQGPVALRFLVESLINAGDAPARIKIIDLLTCNPHFLPAVIHERLQEHMPWYGKRNLIKLLGETGTEEDTENILPYLRHEDFRVQRETFLTLYKIGGRNRKQFLLRALEEAAEPIKVQAVAALANFRDAEVIGKMVDLLASHEQFSEQNRNDLLLQLMETLGRCPSPVAYKGVSAFLQTRGQRATKKISEQVWSAAEKALKFLHNELQETRKKHIQASQLRKNALKQAAKMSKTAVTQRVITGLPQEQVVRSLLARGDKEAAGENLLELIERAARLHNFVQAEKLREWLIDIDSSALGGIVLAAEIIDREKIAAIDKGHLEIWNGLYDILTTEEFSAVYHALKHKTYESEEIIVNQGALQGSLFFINSGKVKLYFGEQGNEILVDTMEKGQIVGEAAFFEASVWTISVAAVSRSEISVLKLDALQQWAEDFPGLGGKLQDFCKKFERIEDFIKRTANDRRQHKRYRIVGKATTTLLDERGRSIGTGFVAELFDISAGGLSCLLRISQKENARLLLGRKMLVQLPEGIKTTEGITLVGNILAVKSIYAVEKDYSLHMKFDTVLDRQQLHELVTIMREESPVIE
jgi:CRP-like cAMP-binding protein